jgi:hypothetical protein
MPNPCSTPVPSTCTPTAVTIPRVLDCFSRRFNAATRNAQIPPDIHTPNGDEKLEDKCGTYSKCILQDSPGKVNIPAFKAFRDATKTGRFSDFQSLTLGGTRGLNGPMASYAYQPVGADGSQFGDSTVATPPALGSELYATELIELYWCSLLRDVAFTDYHMSPVAHRAAQELSASPDYQGPTEGGKVTPALLFRGSFPGEEIGPYVSQFFLTPTMFGAAPFDQKYVSYRPNIDYMTDLATWFAVQNGIGTGAANQNDTTLRYLHDGRGFAAFTHVDELYQSYFTAYLVLNSLPSPQRYNPGSPYMGAKTQNGFGTFGGPDFSSVLGQVAKAALNSCWYQKWFVHLRHRPESGGGLVHLINTSTGAFDGQPLPRVLHSHAVKASFDKYGTYLLAQTFPEGSPAHPAYPTGHGAVGGACITVLKYFFNGDLVLTNPQVPALNGTELQPWDYNPATGKPGLLTVNGELHKLAHNVTFGHGLHGGIHWRSDSDASIKLGEAVAIRMLEDLTCTYAEPVNITITKLDGTTHTFQN